MTERDDLVRALVFAFPADGTLAERIAAVERIVDVHRLWPLVAYERAIERARALDEELRWYIEIGIDVDDEERARAA